MLNPELFKEIKAYCILNDMDIDETVNKCLRNGFNLLKYKSPSDMSNKNGGYQPITDNTTKVPPPESGTGNSNNLYSE